METISMRGINILLGIAVLAFSLGQSSVHGADLSFCCSSTNDLYKALGSKWPRYEHPDQAIRKARNGSAVLLLADGYPHQRLNLAERDMVPRLRFGTLGGMGKLGGYRLGGVVD